jgi:hypothetical protein
MTENEFGPMVNVWKTADTSCPSCDSRLAVAIDLVDDQIIPKPGDLSFCLRCGTLLAFADDMTARYPTAEEKATVDKEELRNAEAFLKAFQKYRYGEDQS